MSKPLIGALEPWYGSKRGLAPTIVGELGPHTVYWEIFCGSMATLLAKPRCSTETVNDLHGDLINLARIIRDEFDGPRLYRRLRRTLCCDAFHAEAKEKLKSETDPFERAYWYFILGWLGRNGVIGSNGGENFAVRYGGGGGNPAVRFESAVLSIPAWHRRLRRVVILQKDAFKLLARIIDQPGVAIYCDPPYLVKGAKYIHDFEKADHGRLAEALGRFRAARVVVSYYDHPDLELLYPGWRVVRPPSTKAMANMGGSKGGKVVAPEVLLINTGAERSVPRKILEVAPVPASGGLFGP